MSTNVPFSASACTRLSERTAYETWFLEAVYAIAEREIFPKWLEDSVIYPVDKSKAKFFTFARVNGMIGDWRPSFLNAGAPLVFVCTFKLLDMLVEWALEENNIAPTFRFTEKLQRLTASPVFPPLIETRPWLKERIIGLYRTLEPYRGTIIHGNHFTSTAGSISVSSSKRGNIGPREAISASQLRSLAVTAVSVLKYVVGAWQPDQIREKYLRYDLDQLHSLHGLPHLGQKSPLHIRVRAYLECHDPLKFDATEVHDSLSSFYPNQECSFDLLMLMVEGREVARAYLFPWRCFASSSADWANAVGDPEIFRTHIPADIDPEHLRHGVN